MQILDKVSQNNLHCPYLLLVEGLFLTKEGRLECPYKERKINYSHVYTSIYWFRNSFMFGFKEMFWKLLCYYITVHCWISCWECLEWVSLTLCQFHRRVMFFKRSHQPLQNSNVIGVDWVKWKRDASIQISKEMYDWYGIKKHDIIQNTK